ncbi:polysaccharide deacetylase family protein [Reyranella sp. CPCC 100927]|uniref:polysaccharide deacetylase family protein n=1 Tax=Reyranella sp. CPCC 100927 TaxID=2599616 RepID=UPI0011B5D52E|nr:polysaccharide deacetylase family protein [Reyranella sp. CPCC 100927]TWS99620.1 polysaccharide deacetylase [Reyranella sp. CPCC 100927]
MTVWALLDDELAHWADSGRTATLWWRDDDAVAATAALDRLLAMRAAYDLGLALAVVPATMDASLAARLQDEPASVAVLQHGYAHQNHAAAGEKSVELGPHRPAPVVIGELGTGLMALSQTFGARFLPVMVPPWNRIAPALVPVLPEIGFRALSTYTARTRVEPVRGLLQVNTHVGPIGWRPRRGFLGDEQIITTLVDALRARRDAAATSPVADEPTGMLTHHLVHDEDIWTFLDRLWNRLRAHPAVRIVQPAAIFGS